MSVNWWQKRFQRKEKREVQRVQVSIAENSLDWAFNRGKAVQANLYQLQIQHLQGAHCFKHREPVPLFDQGNGDYRCLFCKQLRTEQIKEQAVARTIPTGGQPRIAPGTFSAAIHRDIEHGVMPFDTTEMQAKFQRLHGKQSQ